ncbi:MAG TPA: 50S ribosomal protein L28 [Bdellovibrionota bacterium]|jgi:large subunit ribosomal protein L28
MSQVCELTGKRPGYGNKVSHSNIKTRTRWMPNLRKKSYEIPELKQTVSLMLSTRAIRTIDKLGGITPALMKAGEKALSERLQTIRQRIYKARVKRTSAPKAAKKKTQKTAK